MEESLKLDEFLKLSRKSAVNVDFPEHDPFMLNGITLAYIGDAVFELLSRSFVFENGFRQADTLHKHTISLVNAHSQSEMAGMLLKELDEKEIMIFKRGRNASSINSAKHQSIGDYKKATGLEALFGYLYLNGESERLKELFLMCVADYKDQC